MKTFPEVEAFIACHNGQACFRRPILAIVGGTRLGKSLLAADVLRRVGDALNLPEFVEVTVEASEEMDLADFDWRRLTEPAYQCPKRLSEAEEVASSAPPPDRKRRWIGSPARVLDFTTNG